MAGHVRQFPSIPETGSELPFTGGWIGYFTYEAGLGIEGVPAPLSGRSCLPLARFNLYDAAAVYDHKLARWYVTAVDWPRPLAGKRPSVRQRINAMRGVLRSALQGNEAAAFSDFKASRPRPGMTYDEYSDRVARVLSYINAGDVYQVNLTQQFTVTTDATPLELYRRLRQVNPSSHAAFLPWGGCAVLSSSPELFLSLRGKQVTTRPIKGTRPRAADPALDILNRRDLLDSEKEKAELTMIVDLLRNDLGRVCRYGSIEVAEASRIESHPTVFHRVATIRGILESGLNWVDLLLATCPGGSITGAPKIRAMQIIAELEPEWRGVYCGSIGTIGLDGSIQLNIAIRTMVHQGEAVRFGAGGGIVADSRTRQEYDEVWAKAEGMVRALGCPAPSRESQLVTAGLL